MSAAFESSAFYNSAFEVAAAGGSVSLSMAATDGADSASATTGLAVALALAATDGADSASATTRLAISTSLSGTDGADSASATFSVGAGAASLALDATDGPDTADATLELVASGEVDLSCAATDGADECYALVPPVGLLIGGGGGGPRVSGTSLVHYRHPSWAKAEELGRIKAQAEARAIAALQNDQWIQTVASVAQLQPKRAGIVPAPVQGHEDMAIRLLLLAS